MIIAPRHLSRLTNMVGLFTRYGLGDFARDQGIDALPREDSGAPGDAQEASPETAIALRERLVELGPAYIKLGQLLSTRHDLLPESYIRELQKLQDHVDPAPYEQIVEVVEAELGGRMSKLFSQFDEEPLATASLGQAHGAILRSGREVVVKVQRPGIRTALNEDAQFFRELAQFMTEHSAAGKRVDMSGIVEQLVRTLAEELDYRVEARDAEHFRRSLAEFPLLLAPRVVAGYSTERVITTDRVHGLKIDAVSAFTRQEVDFGPVAEQLMRAYLKQITIEGHFHADPHPGNVFVILPPGANAPESAAFGVEAELEVTSNGNGPRQGAQAEFAARVEMPTDGTGPDHPAAKVALIDFGMTARLSPGMRESFVRMMFGLADDRGEDVAEALTEAGEKLPDFDRAKFFSEVATVIAHTTRVDPADRDAGMVLQEIISTAYSCGLRLPAEFALLAKTLANLGTITRALDPSFDPIGVVKNYMTEIATNRAQLHMNPRQLYKIINESASLVSVLPHRIDRITEQLANNEFGARLDFPQIAVLLEGLQKVANRVFTGLVLAAIVVASAMLLPQRPVLGTGGFLIAGALALYMVVTILVSDRRKN